MKVHRYIKGAQTAQLIQATLNSTPTCKYFNCKQVTIVKTGTMWNYQTVQGPAYTFKISHGPFYTKETPGGE